MTTAVLLICSAPAASADQSAADTCAAALPPPAKAVFDAVMEDPQPATPLRRLLAERVGKLVYRGRLPLSEARGAAFAASDCLRIARDCTADVC